MTDLPYTLIAELTHRCPLTCAYCSNPVQAAPPSELNPSVWLRVLEEARDLGVVQAHVTGGEPLLYRELARLVEHATRLGLSSQLVTSAVGLARERLLALRAAGLSTVQISLHELAGRAWPPEHALRAARWVREIGLSLTLNLVLYRGNLDRVAAVIALAEELGADRLELANVQYLGWAFDNRAGLIPDATTLANARQIAAAARERLRGNMDLVFVRADYHAGRPRACMQGWGRRFVVVAPDGTALPCHAAHVLGLEFDNVAETSLADIWFCSKAFALFRGDAWMRDPCRSCELKAVDFGGCRCQAHLLTGDARAADPACSKSPHHARVSDLVADSGRLVRLRARRSYPSSR
jgi:pyrroloquinoline quinone biosynthesis protein E